MNRVPIITKDCEYCTKEIPVGYIYITINKANGKKYIGKHSSNGIKDKNYLGSGFVLSKSIEKYGSKNFDNWVLQWAYSEIQLNELEIQWIEECKAVESEYYYNIKSGGDGFTSSEVKERWELGLYKNIKGDNNPSKKDEVKKKLSERTQSYSRNNPDFVENHALKLKECWNQHRDKFPQCNIGKDNPAFNRGKPVLCVETSMRFDNCNRAAEWIIQNYEGYSKASGDKIRENCKGKSKSAYGFHWIFC